MITCSAEVYRRSNGAFGLPKSTVIQTACGRPAITAFRGVKERPDGKIYLRPWEGRCSLHHVDNAEWDAWMRREFPGIGKRKIVAP